PRDEWTEIPVPAIVTEDMFARVQQRLADNKRFAARNTKVPSLLQGLAACSACGYGYYRTSTRTTSKKIYYYRCLGSDDYRYAASLTPATARPPTRTPTSSSPTACKASSPGCAPAPQQPPSKNASGYCGCWSRTSSSAPRRSPSATASPPAQEDQLPVNTKPSLTRRVTIARVIHCVGGVMMPPCGVPVWVSSRPPSSVRTPALRNALTSASTPLSLTLRR